MSQEHSPLPEKAGENPRVCRRVAAVEISVRPLDVASATSVALSPSRGRSCSDRPEASNRSAPARSDGGGWISRRPRPTVHVQTVRARWATDARPRDRSEENQGGRKQK